MALKAPEFDLSKDEAEKLTKAIANVSQFYPVGLSPKTLAWLNLGSVAGGIYGTRIVALMMKSKNKPKAPALAKPINTAAPAAKNGEPLTPSQLYGYANAGVE